MTEGLQADGIQSHQGSVGRLKRLPRHLSWYNFKFLNSQRTWKQQKKPQYCHVVWTSYSGGPPGGIWVGSFLFTPSFLLFLVFPLPVLLYFPILSALLLPSFLGSLPSRSGGVTPHFYSGLFSPDLTLVSEMRGDKRLKPQRSGSPHVLPLPLPTWASWGLVRSQHWRRLRTEQAEKVTWRLGVAAGWTEGTSRTISITSFRLPTFIPVANWIELGWLGVHCAPCTTAKDYSVSGVEVVQAVLLLFGSSKSILLSKNSKGGLQWLLIYWGDAALVSPARGMLPVLR